MYSRHSFLELGITLIMNNSSLYFKEESAWGALQSVSRAVQSLKVQCSAVQCSAVQSSAVQFSLVQFSAVQCSAVQLSAVPCSAADNVSATIPH